MLRSRRRSRRPRALVAAVIAAVAALAGTVVAVARAGRLRPTLDRLPRSIGGSRPGQENWRCACGARYRVSGMDRHRVYWPAGASVEQPVLGSECPECGRPLPT